MLISGQEQRRTGTSRVFPPILMKGLKDPNTWVRSHCASGLSRLLNGPIWARVSKDSIETILNNFPDMPDEDISKLLVSIKMRPDAINRFLRWRSSNFDVEIDRSALVEELETSPILLTEEKKAPEVKAEVPGLSKEVESILAELPEEVIATLPPEDLKRLFPASLPGVHNRMGLLLRLCAAAGIHVAISGR